MDMSDPIQRALASTWHQAFHGENVAHPLINGQVPGLYFTVKSFHLDEGSWVHNAVQ